MAPSRSAAVSTIFRVMGRSASGILLSAGMPGFVFRRAVRRVGLQSQSGFDCRQTAEDFLHSVVLRFPSAPSAVGSRCDDTHQGGQSFLVPPLRFGAFLQPDAFRFQLALAEPQFVGSAYVFPVAKILFPVTASLPDVKIT